MKQHLLQEIPSRSEQWGAFILQVIQQRWTYRKICYLFVSIPLGFCVSGFLLIGILGAILTLVLGIGFPLLYIMIVAWWLLAMLERSLAQRLLNIHIPLLPASLLDISQGRFWARLRIHLTQSITWKTLAYLLVKGPLALYTSTFILAGLLFSFAISAMIIALVFFTAPLLVLGGTISHWRNQQKRTLKVYRKLIDACTITLLSPLGLLVIVADLWSYFTNRMLSIDDHERELLQAHAMLRQERERAERAEQQRRDLIANLSHDLRTPVANIRGHADALLQSAQEPQSIYPMSEQQHTYLAIIQREALRLSTLFDELLALAREEKHELTLAIEAIDLGEVIEEVYQTIKPLAYKQRRITVSRTVHKNLPLVKVDRQRIQQVLLNLLRNAIAYTPEGGLVAITLEQANSTHLVMAVADTGIGIAPEDQERIFERFYRPTSTATRSSAGLGLGLAIVRELVEAMHGSITLESSPGEGCCFMITLPIGNTTFEENTTKEENYK